MKDSYSSAQIYKGGRLQLAKLGSLSHQDSTVNAKSTGLMHITVTKMFNTLISVLE